jgi:hypothetical protein
MADELWHLRPFAHEGPERIASRLIATIGVRRAERSAGRAASTHDERIATDIAALVGRQRPDGGWAWCDDPLCSTDPRVTGWALLALGEARRDGVAVDAGVVGRASAYVLAYVSRAADVAWPADPSDKAFMLAALAAAGGGDRAIVPARALFEQYRSELTSWGRAYLLLALDGAAVPADDPDLKALLNDVAAATLPSANGNHWEDRQVRGSFMTSAASTGLVTLALARLRPEQALLAQSVRWLVIARGSNGWHTSIDRSLGILALTTYAEGTGELGGEYDFDVRVGDKPVLSGSVTRGAAPLALSKAIPLTTFRPGAFSLLALSREFAKPGRLYYTLDLRYVTPAKGIEAVNRGFAVSHEYTSLADPKTPLASVPLGEIVRVKVTVLAPGDRSYVTVEDLLPAGLEAIDGRLRTVDPKLKAQLDADRRAAAERSTGAPIAPWYRWYYSPWQHVELRDDRAVLYAQHLPKGMHEYIYYARATTPGDFFVAPAHASESYFPEVFGRSDSARLTVTK